MLPSLKNPADQRLLASYPLDVNEPDTKKIRVRRKRVNHDLLGAMLEVSQT